MKYYTSHHLPLIVISFFIVNINASPIDISILSRQLQIRGGYEVNITGMQHNISDSYFSNGSGSLSSLISSYGFNNIIRDGEPFPVIYDVDASSSADLFKVTAYADAYDINCLPTSILEESAFANATSEIIFKPITDYNNNSLIIHSSTYFGYTSGSLNDLTSGELIWNWSTGWNDEYTNSIVSPFLSSHIYKLTINAQAWSYSGPNDPSDASIWISGLNNVPEPKYTFLFAGSCFFLFLLRRKKFNAK